MKRDPILEEAWQIKDEMAREAGGDIHRLCENTRRWAQSHTRTGPVVRDADEVRKMAEEALAKKMPVV